MKRYGLIWLILLVLIFLPKIGSTPFVKPLFVRAFEKKIEGRVEIGSLQFSWFGPQIFHNLKWDKDGVSGAANELSVAAPFWSFQGPFTLKNGSIAYQKERIEKIEGQMEGNDFTLSGITQEGPISVKGTFQMEKGRRSLDLALDSTNLRTHLKGVLTEKALTLEEPLIASIQLTPSISALLLKDANPLFLTGLSADKPAILRIEPENFSFPLPYSLEKLAVGSATLDLGKIVCQNGPSLAAIVALLKEEALSNSSQMSAWFTPVAFNLHQGRLVTGRMDALLADSIHICTWGSIDLRKDQLDMTLGIPSDTLKKAFGIKNLPKNYVMTMPIRGSTQKPEIVTGPAVAKIAALIAASQNEILGELLSKPKEEKEIPPAQRPLPWER
ncbi:MAG: hypothetical protein WCF19_01120 [Chlamydiales bacterium]